MTNPKTRPTKAGFFVYLCDKNPHQSFIYGIKSENEMSIYPPKMYFTYKKMQNSRENVNFYTQI
jgi:hypothetical protein